MLRSGSTETFALPAPRPRVWWKWVVCALAFAVYAVVGLSAVRLEGLPRLIRNGAEPVEGGGIHWDAPGLARSRAAPAWLEAVRQGGDIQIELEARSFSQAQCGPARILTISRNTSLRNLTIAQQNADLVIRIRTPDTDLNGEPALVIPGVFADDDFHQIDLHLEGTDLILMVDGDVRLRDTMPADPLAGWDTRYRVLVGNEVGGLRPWRGEIRSAIVRAGGETIDYARSGILEIPSRYWVFGSEPPCGERRADDASGIVHRRLRDMTVNLLVFLPLGCLFGLLWRHLSMLTAGIVFGGLSLFIEVSQFLVPGHNPQISDLVLNTLGGVIGVLLVRAVSAFLSRFKAQQVVS